jgi:ferredoxin
LLALHADRKSAPVVLLDRGWCGECETWKASGHPAAAHLREAARLLESIGVPEAATPRLAREPLPSALAGNAHADPLAHAQLSRRGFFGSAAREATFAWSGAVEATSKKASGPVERIRPVERLKRLSLLASIVGVSTAELPGGLFPAIGVGETCTDHEVCAGVCPTGALSRYAKDGASGLRFDPRLCIDCGACERACPEQALQMYRESVPGQAQVGRPLTRHLQRTCTECGNPFSVRNDASKCPQCAKRAELARAGSLLSMSARQAAPPPRA